MSMTEYTIIPDGLHGYGVEVRVPNRFLSVRGFSTEFGAAAWIAEQQAVEVMVAAASGQSPGLTRLRGFDPGKRDIGPDQVG